ncbi:MAG: putative toxin-antitoxin system toxin component, PIN family [bacterium]|nr:putative toxin-antitoxin system toxin component, PIN family [Acidimicrobiia bacterium]MCY4650457.1 putative toxin-antitoxin system toxin component, PIN family [bacterium]
MRLVIDTNVLLSALLFSSGSLTWLRSAWKSKVVLPLASHDTTLELIRVLSYPKFCLNDYEREELLTDYLPWCETVTVARPPAVPQCRDPHDRPFLELALVGRADALVTGDKDLLVLAPQFSVPILTPKTLEGRLEPPQLKM